MSLRREKIGTTELWTIDREKKLNAIDASVLDALEAAISAVARDESVRAVVLTGAGERAFAAGADIAAMRQMTAIEAEAFAERGQRLFSALSALPVPVIAAVSGFALGGGCELAMACDIVIASSKARFGQPEVKLGVIPGFGGTQRLARRVGMAAALDLCLSARMVGAEEALRMGICSRVVEGSALEAAMKVASEVAAFGPVALRLCKRAIHENADSALSSALAAERTLFGLCFGSEDQDEGMAAFLEDRPPAFRGR